MLCVVIALGWALGWALRWALLWKLRAAMLTNGDKVFHLSVTEFEARDFGFCATQHFRKGPTWIRLRFLQAGVWIAPFWWLTKLTARRSIRSMCSAAWRGNERSGRRSTPSWARSTALTWRR